MSLSLLIVQTLNGLQLGVLLFLIAAGLTLVFGVMVSSTLRMASSTCWVPIWR